jgi:hypothetical protein
MIAKYNAVFSRYKASPSDYNAGILTYRTRYETTMPIPR